MVKNIDFTIFVSIYPFVSLFVSSLVLFDRSFIHLFVCSCLWSCGHFVFWSCVRQVVFLFVFFRLLVVCSCGRVIVWSFHSLDLLIFSSCVRLYSICLFRVFSEGRFPEAVYFYGISQDSKFTLSLLQLTEKEATNARSENGKASMQRLAENIANLDPEVILLYTTEENIQLLMTQTVCWRLLIRFSFHVFFHCPRRPNTKSEDHWFYAEDLSNIDESNRNDEISSKRGQVRIFHCIWKREATKAKFPR